MLIQQWTLPVAESRWLRMLRICSAVSLVFCAGWVLAFVAGGVGVSGWWGDWLWPWPILLYLTWVVAFLPAPVLASTQTLTLTETGEIGEHLICHSLRTPWLIALQLSSQRADHQPGGRLIGRQALWVWVFRDQLSAASWTRLNRVCQNPATSLQRPV